MMIKSNLNQPTTIPAAPDVCWIVVLVHTKSKPTPFSTHVAAGTTRRHLDMRCKHAGGTWCLDPSVPACTTVHGQADDKNPKND